jgi:hypothetical protein
LRVLETVQNTSRKAEWDEVFEGVRLLKTSADGQTRLEHHVYKVPKAAAVLGVSKRDFCVLGRWVIQQDGTILVAVSSTPAEEAIAHGCPPSKKFVRGTIHLGGFVIRALPPSIVHKTVYKIAPEESVKSVDEVNPRPPSDRKLTDLFEAPVAAAPAAVAPEATMAPEAPVPASSASLATVSRATAWQKLMSAARCQVTFVAHVDLGGNIPSFVQKLVGVKQPQSIASLRKLVLTEQPIDAERASIYRDAFGRHDPNLSP